MTYRGHVKDGVVVLDPPRALPEGAKVEVRLVESLREESAEEKQPPTVAERLAPFIGKLKGLPADLSTNHDHYLYGAPKRR